MLYVLRNTTIIAYIIFHDKNQTNFGFSNKKADSPVDFKRYTTLLGILFVDTDPRLIGRLIDQD